MEEYVFGANVIENLTTGMYQDSRVIYREYIQNACDQIDEACRQNLLSDKSQGKIEIWLDPTARTISIKDNATGIPANKFAQTLGNIADSDKRIGEARGFRGIGRLCGLAYCRELVFTSKAAGENIISIMKCNAKHMRELIAENSNGLKHTASEVLHRIYEFSTQKTNDTESHWFQVELVDVNKENRDLLDFNFVKDYLSFVAPAPYQNKFIFRNKVYEHARAIGCHIDEYSVYLNAEQVFKKYGTHFKTSKGEDEIFDVQFKDFMDDDGNLIAWSWIGLSGFKAIIQKDCPMRGLRLRKENIQIGGEDALQKLFREDRGSHYFVGEVFAVDKDLIPNSQRDYFNENERRNDFERRLRTYFEDELHRIYYEGSAINSAFTKIEIAEKKDAEFRQRQETNAFVDQSHLENAEREVEKARKDAEKARIEIERKKAREKQNPDSAIGRIITRIENQHASSAQPDNSHASEKKPKVEEKHPQHRTDRLSQYSKNERKLITRIFNAILAATDAATAERIISKIEDELQ